MKLTAILVLAFCLHVSARVNSQTITISVKNVKLESVFREVEKQTQYRFFYDGILVKKAKRISVDVRNLNVEPFLEKVLEGQGLEYSIQNYTIVISKKRALSTVSPPTVVTPPAEVKVPPIDVNGRIVNESGEPVNATVTVKGTGRGTSTDENGNFVLRGVDENATLVISGVNVEQKEVKVSGGSINITVKTTVSALQEMVVTGYGREKKVNVIGSVTSVSGVELAKAPVISVTNALAGRLPGAIVSQRNGEPGFEGTSILVRGKGTLGNNSPLVVIDGIQGRDLNTINVNDIESISILKDASAAIYGARAANGVILVTTKRGKSGSPLVTYDFYQGWLTPTKLPEMADAATYAQMIREMQSYQGVDEANMTYSLEDIEKYKSGKFPWTHPNTNWLDEVLKNYSQNRNHNVTVTGGGESVNYYFSFGTQWADAIFKKSPHRYNRYNLKGNVDLKFNKYFSVNFDINGIQDNKKTAGGYELTETRTDERLIFNVANQGRPTDFNNFPNGLPSTGSFGADYQPALLATSNSGFNDRKTYRLNNLITATLRIPWVDGLTMSSFFAYDVILRNNKWFFQPMDAYTFDKSAYLAAGNTGVEDGSDFLVRTANPGRPSLTERRSDFKAKTFNFKINYDKSFNNHNLSVFAAYEQADDYFEEVVASRRYFISNQLPYLFAGGDAEKDNSATTNLDARINYFGRLSYNYKETYLFQFSFRKDGSLRFSKESGRWGNFPSVLVGWRISNENFWKDHVRFFNSFKLKASWGQLGNDRVEPFQYLASYSFTTGGVYGDNRGYQAGLVQNRTPNPNITWEVSNSFNAGFESRFLNNKMFLNADFFYQKRKNILVTRNASVPIFTGISLPDENYGIVDNRGFELEIGFSDRSGDFSYGISANYAFARNKVIEFDEPAQVVPWQIRTGRPQGGYLLYDGIGIFRDQEQINKTPHVAGAIPGDVIIRDVDGDGEITTNDRIIFDKTTDPEFTYGVSFNVGYKNFELTGLISGAGNSMYRMIGGQQGTPGNYFSYYADGRWTPDNIDASKPRAYQAGTPYWRFDYEQDMEYQNTDFARLKTLQLAYNLPARLYSRIRLKSGQIFVSGQNLFLIYNSKGIWDGEFSGHRDLYPLMRTIAVGARLTL